MSAASAHHADLNRFATRYQLAIQPHRFPALAYLLLNYSAERQTSLGFNGALMFYRDRSVVHSSKIPSEIVTVKSKRILQCY